MTREYDYNEELGYETLSDEYKLFTFNPILIDPDESLELLRTQKWVFNESTIQSVRTYLKLYLPKYISSYTHPLTCVTNGNLFIGVDDDGLIYGVPYQGVFPIKIIKEEIDNIFKRLIRIKDFPTINYYNIFDNFEYISTDSEKNDSEDEVKKNRVLTKYKNAIQIKIFNVKKNINLNSEISIYENYIKKLGELEKQYLKYSNKKLVWKKLITEHTLKLHEMLNNNEMRENIITFIKEKSNYSKKSFRNKYSDLYYLCEVRDYYNFISELRSDFQYTSMKNKISSEYKYDLTNVFYWVTRWKDSKTSTLKFIKPKTPKNYSNKNYPMFLLSQVHQMIPEWINTNTDLNLNLIKIKIPGNLDKSKVIEYFDGINWIENYRKVNTEGPTSVPISSFI